MSSQASFLRLPSEVRLRVYHFVFENALIRVHFRPHQSFDYPLPARYSEIASSHDGPHQWVDLDECPLSITETCRTIRNESLTILYSATHLYVCTPEAGVSSPNPRAFLASIPTAILQQVRQLSVDRNLVEHVPLDLLTSLEMLMAHDRSITDWAQGKADVTNEEAKHSFENELRGHGPYQHLRKLREGRVTVGQKYRMISERYTFISDGLNRLPCGPVLVGQCTVSISRALLTTASVFYSM